MKRILFTVLASSLPTLPASLVVSPPYLGRQLM